MTKVERALVRYDIVPRWLLMFGRSYVRFDNLDRAKFSSQIVFEEAYKEGYLDWDNKEFGFSITDKAVEFWKERNNL